MFVMCGCWFDKIFKCSVNSGGGHRGILMHFRRLPDQCYIYHSFESHEYSTRSGDTGVLERIRRIQGQSPFRVPINPQALGHQYRSDLPIIFHVTPQVRPFFLQTARHSWNVYLHLVIDSSKELESAKKELTAKETCEKEVGLG